MILPESVMCIDTHTLSVTKTRFEVSKTEDDVIIKTFRDYKWNSKRVPLERSFSLENILWYTQGEVQLQHVYRS